MKSPSSGTGCLVSAGDGERKGLRLTLRTQAGTRKQKGSSMADSVIYSSDSHLVEQPDLWTERIDPRFKDRAPHMVYNDTDRGDWWYVDGARLFSGLGGADTGRRFDAPETLRTEARFEETRAGAYEPEIRIHDMEIDGVYGEVLYPTLGLLVYWLQDGELLSAICRAYNDWVAEFCRADPKRLKGIAMINVDDVDDAVGELKRSAKMGLSGAMITVYPYEEKSYNRPFYEPFWAAAEELGMSLSLHVATNRGRRGGDPATQEDDAFTVKHDLALISARAYWVQVSIARMIFSGVFERYPALQVISTEHEVAWAAHLLTAMDYSYTQRSREHQYRYKTDALPSDFFHKNVSISFQEDAIGIQLRSFIGVDNLMWGSDYPHAESTFPRSREILDRILAGIPEEERARIAGLNAKKLFGFS